MNKDSYNIGDTLHFYEDGGQLKVEVLENNCDKKWVAYKLKTIEFIRDTPLPFATLGRVGDIFTVSELREGGTPVLGWNLEEITKENENSLP